MKKKRVVITGVGVLASNAAGKENFWNALKEGRSGLKPISLFETDEFQVNMAGEVSDFEAKDYFGPKGVRNMDRSSKLIVAASKLALSDCGFEITDDNTDDVGVSAGTTLGSLKSIQDFDLVTLREGPRYTNPALFPNTVINAPASQVSIWNNIQGFNTTISTGFTASLDAMEYAYDFIQFERAKVIFSGGVEELCHPTYYGFHALKYLSGSRSGQSYISCPFDKRRNGVTFGEGACLLVCEELEHAEKRKANILAEVLGFGSYFDTYPRNRFNPKGTGMIQAMRSALENSECELSDVDYICANANSTQDADKIETFAVKEVFGKKAEHIPMSSIKSMIGETYSVSGAMAVAASVGMMQHNYIAPTINFKQSDPACDLDYVVEGARDKSLDTILINNFSPSGNNTCVVLGRYLDGT